METHKNNKALNIALWVAQGLLGLMFIMAGAMKLTMPVEKLAESLAWVTTTPIELVRFIGLSEVLGALGLLLPSLLRIKPGLTVWAAIGLVLVMVLASAFHGSRGEFEAIPVNVFLAVLAAFVAWGRAKKAPISAKHQPSMAA